MRNMQEKRKYKTIEDYLNKMRVRPYFAYFQNENKRAFGNLVKVTTYRQGVQNCGIKKKK